MHPCQVFEKRILANKCIEKDIPEQHNFPTQLRYVTIGQSNELIFTINRLEETEQKKNMSNKAEDEIYFFFIHQQKQIIKKKL